MGLSITILSGKRLGDRYKFSEDRTEITLGRAPEGSEKVDVRLDPYDAGCGREHAAIVRNADGWVVRVHHDNGVALENRGQGVIELEAGDEHPIHDYAYLTLGPNGPCVFVAVDPGILEDEMPQTQRPSEIDEPPPSRKGEGETEELELR